MFNTFERYNPIGQEEKEAVNRVLDSGTLSSFIGSWGNDFFGGKEVVAFEKEIASYFGVKHAITFNSLTSGLMAAVGAIGIEPGDEVIVSPWTMSATATAIVVWGGIPVFADIEPNHYGLDPACITKAITKRTRAIVVTDIFGHGALLDEIQEIAQRHQLRVIEDVAQAPGIRYKGKYCGTWGDIGGFSLNYHKHIHTGEGGFCVTDDDDLALRMQLIRNHAESSVVNSPISDLHNMVGFNFRMGEMEAAIGRVQLGKLDSLLQRNYQKVVALNSILRACEDFLISEVNDFKQHAYYVYPITLAKNSDRREAWLGELRQLGIPGLLAGYVNVHRLPMYKNKMAFGRGSYPWSLSDADYIYGEGTCPLAEDLHDQRFVGFLISMFELSTKQCEELGQAMISAWEKVKHG